MSKNKKKKVLKKRTEISRKQDKFCREYMIDMNGTQAAIRAGYSKKTANEQAAQLLAKLSIQKIVMELQSDLAKKTDLTAQMVIDELRKVGFANIKDYLDKDNDVMALVDLDAKETAAVSSIKIVEQTFGEVTTKSTSFKLHDKISALEKLGRHLGIFEVDNMQSGLNGAIIKITKKK